jgi:putative DNA primase/helicase
VHSSTDLPVVQPPEWDNIPSSLATRQQWLLWKFERKEGQAKPGKIPYYVRGGRRTGGQGTDGDRARLATLEVVRRAYERGDWSGIGFAFLPGDGLIGIDVDGAIDLTTGEVTERLQRIVQACASFTEYSPSGKGAHIIVEGHTTTNKSNDIGLEVFCERQFFTFTGKRWPGTPATVEPISEAALKRLHATIDEAKAAARAAVSPPRPSPVAQPVASTPAGGNDFERVNQVAMGSLSAWVTALLPGAVARGPGFRVTSKALGRDLQEDLSITPEGIVDFGVADMGDPKMGSRTPIDLVMEWLPASKPVDALKWLAQRIGVELTPPPGRSAPKPSAREKSAPAGGVESAGSGGSSNPPPNAFGEWGEADEEGGVDGALVRRGKRPADCRENVLYCMRLDPLLMGLARMNDFTELLERSRPTPWGREAGEWDEEDDLMLGEYLLREYNLMVKSPGTLRAGVRMAARLCRYNPVLDLIRAEVWDGVDRLEHWMADCLGVEDRAYTRLVGACFIKGMVNRALNPGCKFDYMLILKGPQGAKKSTVFRTLAAPWFTDNAIKMGDKDSLMAMQSIWLAESSELESMNKSETNAIKQFLSASEDLFRPPYGAQMVKRPRHAVFGGTTNAETFLKDVTGDRRFWPLEVGELNLEALQAQRLQLFAEALHKLQSDDAEQRRTYPNRQEEHDLIFPEQERFKVTDVWEDILYDYVNRTTPHRHDDPKLPVPAKRPFFSTRELFEHALQIKADRIDGGKNMETRIGNCMRSIGFDKYRESSGERKRGYMRRPLEVAPTTPDTPTEGAPAPAGRAPEGNQWEDDDLPI